MNFPRLPQLAKEKITAAKAELEAIDKEQQEVKPPIEKSFTVRYFPYISQINAAAWTNSLGMGTYERRHYCRH